MQADGDGPLFADAAEMVIAAAAILARESGKRRAQMVLELAGRVPPAGMAQQTMPRLRGA